jgi:hypothetical protein
MHAAVSDKSLSIPAMLKDNVRASLLKQLVLVLMSEEEK